ncbi:MAG: hypothetical protein ABIO49_04070 [Dokdonella sp.]
MLKIRWLSAAAASVFALFTAPSRAVIICMAEQNIAVPQDGEGAYINFVTGMHGGSQGAVPGFDFDPYASQASNPSNQLKFYWGSASNNGAGVVTTGDTYAVLTAGNAIGPASIFSRAGFTGVTTAWQAGVTVGYLGTRFTNETTNTLTYGWVHLTTSAPLGFPMNVLDWCYEDGGSAITVPQLDIDRIYCDGFDDLACAGIATAY